MADLYKDEIVDPGDKASRLAKTVSVDSFENSRAITVKPHKPGDFRGPVGYRWNENVLRAMLDCVAMEEMENDGAGGKPQFFTLLGTEECFYGLGWEIITMCADDFARSGRFPVLMSNIIDTKAITKENFHLFEAMMNGFRDALSRTNLVNITGEIAVMKHSVTAFCDMDEPAQLILNWGAAMVGLSHDHMLLDGSWIRPGMPVVGLHEQGYRCNGGTFFTNLLQARWKGVFGGGRENGRLEAAVKALTVPSLCYSPLITDLHGWQADGSVRNPRVRMAGIAHITGGGMNKFQELLPTGVGADLNNMPEPPLILSDAQKWSEEFPDLTLSDRQCYTTFHGGCGMVVVLANESEVIPFIDLAGKAGFDANCLGETTVSKDRAVHIKSRFKNEETVVLSDKDE